MIATKSKIKPLGEYLLEAGLLTPDRLKIALDKQKNTSLRLGELLSSLGWVSQETIEYLVEKVVLPQRQASYDLAQQKINLVNMLAGPWISQALYVAATLGIADLLAEEAKTIDELARTTNTNPFNLYRVLRALASVGVFTEIEPRKFAITEIAEYLRKDSPNSLRSLVMMVADEWHWRSWGEVLHVVRTGQPAIEKIYCVDNTFKYLSQNPKSGSLFNEAMSNFSKNFHTAVVGAYDFSGFTKIVDVAGGHGMLIASILTANPAMKGILFDLPDVVADAAKLLEKEQLSDRCQRVGGNFFESVPSGGDAYILSYIIHDWNDEDCLKILKNIRLSIAEGGKLIVIEGVVPTGDRPHFTKLLDLEMMIIYPSGRERTEAEYRQLFQTAGFRLTRIVPTLAPVSAIEAVCI